MTSPRTWPIAIAALAPDSAALVGMSLGGLTSMAIVDQPSRSSCEVMCSLT